MFEIEIAEHWKLAKLACGRHWIVVKCFWFLEPFLEGAMEVGEKVDVCHLPNCFVITGDNDSPRFFPALGGFSFEVDG